MKAQIILSQDPKMVMSSRYTKARNKKISDARVKKMRELGYLNSPDTRQKMSDAKKGKTPWNKGKKMPESMRLKMSEITSKRLANPENHYNWKGGKSFEPYPSKFTKQLKNHIHELDGRVCQLCGLTQEDSKEKLAVHHVDYNKENCDDSNLITLCRPCNSKVNYGREEWTAYFKGKVQRLKTEYPEKDNDIV